MDSSDLANNFNDFLANSVLYPISKWMNNTYSLNITVADLMSVLSTNKQYSKPMYNGRANYKARQNFKQYKKYNDQNPPVSQFFKIDPDKKYYKHPNTQYPKVELPEQIPQIREIYKAESESSLQDRKLPNKIKSNKHYQLPSVKPPMDEPNIVNLPPFKDLPDIKNFNDIIIPNINDNILPHVKILPPLKELRQAEKNTDDPNTLKTDLI